MSWGYGLPRFGVALGVGDMDSPRFGVELAVEDMDSHALAWPLELGIWTPHALVWNLELRIWTPTLWRGPLSWGYGLPHFGMAPRVGDMDYGVEDEVYKLLLLIDQLGQYRWGVRHAYYECSKPAQ